ncbi:hypothetical protein MBLNU459_g7338t2 [Dothideomycetes sp. NU459]
MADTAADLNELFAAPDTELQQDVLGELQSVVRVHSLSPQELFFKWEAYSIKMGPDTRMDYKTARDFKKDLQDALERESRGKAHTHSASKRSTAATPRSSNTGDVFGVLDGIMAGTPQSRTTMSKRRNNFETPSAKATKTNATSSPGEQRTPALADPVAGQTGQVTTFADRPNAGQIVEQLNAHMAVPSAPSEPPAEPRVKLKANTELPKFAYKPMAMKLSEASEILDDRIDEFASIVQDHHKLQDSAFGNPAAQSPAEIIAVGRIASDSSEGKLNAASVVLETSRRTGAGMRVPLRMDGQTYDFFPGKIVALRGINPSGEFFSVSEVLSIPALPIPASTPADLKVHNARVVGPEASTAEARPLNILVGSGPFTTETDLSFDALHELCSKAAESVADVLVLAGPFLDLEHPLIASGDFDLPSDLNIDPEDATMVDVFRAFVAAPLTRLVRQNPSITVILVPSVRDAISKHVSWPQDRFNRKELGLPKQVTCVTNPITLSINEIMVGITTEDALYEMQRQRVASGSATYGSDTLAALSSNIITQRHYFPVFPPLPRAENGLSIGASIDISYLKLGEILKVSPDLLIVPSVLTPFAKVVENVMVVNPGYLSKKRGAGTYAQLSVAMKRIDEAQSGEAI